MRTHQIAYGTSLLLTGLLAGLFYGYQCSVIKGLGALNDREYLLAFQSINKEIQNPLFFISFIGSMMMLPVAAYLFYKNNSSGVFPFLMAAAAVYTIGVFGITVALHIPLNEMLAEFNIHEASQRQLTEMRTHFEPTWNTWHQARTIASITVLITLLIPVIKKL